MSKEKKDRNKKPKKSTGKKSPVIRKLRIEFIVVMMTIVVVFLAVIFGVQYYSSRKAMQNETKEALNTALSGAMFLKNRDIDPFFDGGMPDGNLPDGNLPDGTKIPEEIDPPNGGNNNGNNGFGRRGEGLQLSDFRDRKSRTAILIAVIDSEEKITVYQNNIFFIENEDVESLLKSAIAAEKDEGKIEDHSLQYMKKTLDNGSTAVAFVDVSSESSLLKSDLVRSIWISLSVIVVMFLLSLVLSKLTIRPVERAWEDQRRFVADASHELKTPLTVIMSNTDMVQHSLQGLQKDNGGEENRQISAGKLDRNLHRLENVREESLRMKELIGELLEVARGDVGQNVADFQDLSLSEVVSDAQITWESVYFEQGKILTGNIEEDLTVHGDRTTLRRLVEILLDNALKYSKERSEVLLTLKREKSGKRLLHISVANEGTPLTEEEISHLFDRFYRSDSSREKTSGYGLGLSIAQSIVEAHKGRIWAEADGTKGNIFHVTLPG